MSSHEDNLELLLSAWVRFIFFQKLFSYLMSWLSHNLATLTYRDDSDKNAYIYPFARRIHSYWDHDEFIWIWRSRLCYMQSESTDKEQFNIRLYSRVPYSLLARVLSVSADKRNRRNGVSAMSKKRSAAYFGRAVERAARPVLQIQPPPSHVRRSQSARQRGIPTRRRERGRVHHGSHARRRSAQRLPGTGILRNLPGSRADGPRNLVRCLAARRGHGSAPGPGESDENSLSGRSGWKRRIIVINSYNVYIFLIQCIYFNKNVKKKSSRLVGIHFFGNGFQRVSNSKKK